MQRKIFINYRRNDAPTSTGRIYERLCLEIGAASLFRDLNNIPLGTDFTRVLEASIEECQVMLSIIGPHWLSSRAFFRRRIDERDDLVRFEIATAIRQRLHIIPLLVDGAQMPPERELPEEIRSLAKRNALVVNPRAFDADLTKLASALKALIEAGEESPNAHRVGGDREFLRGSRLLWVDDQALNQYEQRALETLGIEIVRARDTHEGLSVFDSERFHLVVSDMRRPSGPDAGYDLLEQIRLRSPATPFVLYTSTAADIQQDAWSRGAQVATDNVRELIGGVVGHLLSRRLGGVTPQPEMTRIAGSASSRAVGGMDARVDPTVTPYSPAREDAPVVGWLVIIEGPGRGRSREILPGANTLGRGTGQAIQLDFGDDSISREQAVLVYSGTARKFMLAPSPNAKALVYVGDTTIVGETALTDRDIMRVGNTSLLFIALCGGSFTWN